MFICTSVVLSLCNDYCTIFIMILNDCCKLIIMLFRFSKLNKRIDKRFWHSPSQQNINSKVNKSNHTETSDGRKTGKW